MPDWAEVWSVGTSQERATHKITVIELHRLAVVFQTKTHNKMTTRRDCYRSQSHTDAEAHRLSAQCGIHVLGGMCVTV